MYPLLCTPDRGVFLTFPYGMTVFFFVAFLASSLTAGIIGYAIAAKSRANAEEAGGGGQVRELEAQVQAARKAFSSLGVLLSRTHESVESQSHRLGALRRDLAAQKDADPYDIVAILESEIDRILAENLRLSSDLREARQTVARQEDTLDDLREQASTDGLTRIANRREFDTRIFAQQDRFERLGEAYSLVLIDIDHFKKVNDKHGHPSGDKVIAGVAETAASCINPADLAARYGGEEFAILLPRATLGGARLTAEKIREKVERTSFWCDSGPVSVTVSLGVAQVHDGEALEALIRRTDEALYNAKRSGRNQVQAATPDPQDLQQRIRETVETVDDSPVAS